MHSRFHNPVSTIIGAGALASLPAVLAGRRTVLLSFPEARALGLVERVRALLGPALIAVETETVPNPDAAFLARLYDWFWEAHPEAEAILALGGGSVIDAAKALMVGVPSRRFGELFGAVKAGTEIAAAAVKPLVAIPTTAGTGSEVTPWATIWDRTPGTLKKYSLHLAETWPEAAIVDPELTLSAPPAVTLAAGLDALSHSLEAIWNVNANPVSDALAVSAARAILRTLPALLERRSDIELRAAMSIAALKAGLAFSNTKTALAHSISYEMTLRHGLAHGIACSFSLPMVLSMAIGVAPDRDAVLAEIFDGPLDRAPAMLEAFLARLGVATRFEQYGVGQAEAAAMLQSATAGARGRNFIGARSPAAAPA
ncbi:MAG TPA: iron-containing alcohol dehydrogenase PsrA [Stellaceae bacterium]|nr:iron-containing alcohol dehydrogenase PsrA [Stellaceae bacterium]